MGTERNPPKIIAVIRNAKDELEEGSVIGFESEDAWGTYVQEHGLPMMEEGSYVAVYKLSEIGEIETIANFTPVEG